MSETTTTAPRWSRKRKAAAGGVALAVIASGTAAAIYYQHAVIRGDATLSTLNPQVTAMALDTALDMTCGVSVSGGYGDIAISNTFGASRCDFTATVDASNGDAVGWISGIGEVGLPTGYSLTIRDGAKCGLEVSEAGAPVSVPLRLALDSTAVSGSWNAETIGVEVTPASQMSKVDATTKCLLDLAP